MLEKTRRQEGLSILDLVHAGYKRINQWKYVKQINEKERWHAIIAGRFIHLHKDTTIKNKFGWQWHTVKLSNIKKEFGRIKSIRNTRKVV